MAHTVREVVHGKFLRDGPKKPVFRDRQNELMITLNGVEGGLGSMNTELMALGRRVAGFGTPVSVLVRAQRVPTPGVPIQGAPKNSPDEGWSIKVDGALQEES